MCSLRVMQETIDKIMAESCCESWGKAQLPGTDNEEWEEVLKRGWDDDKEDHNNEWYIGSNLPPVKFCPWCGAVKD